MLVRMQILINILQKLIYDLARMLGEKSRYTTYKIIKCLERNIMIQLHIPSYYLMEYHSCIFHFLIYLIKVVLIRWEHLLTMWNHVLLITINLHVSVKFWTFYYYCHVKKQASGKTSLRVFSLWPLCVNDAALLSFFQNRVFQERFICRVNIRVET